jgi:23S rRNA (uracil1939-C5)-methyltransferase
MIVCKHFGTCGGCAYQDMPADAYRAMKRELVVGALARQGFADAAVDEVVEVPPGTRRRAAFKVEKRNGETQMGFHAARSHDIVDMRECLVLTPKLFALVAGLRAMMNVLLDNTEAVELDVTDSDTGFDVALRGKRVASTAVKAEIARWAVKLKLARVSVGNEVLIDLGAPSARFGNALVKLPPGAFLQPTREGEAALQARVMAAAKGARRIADLFAGCGTFALVLAEQARVHAVEREPAMLDALAAAARMTQGLKPVTIERRDLFKQPLTPPEIAEFDTVVLDPPRAGAAAQCAQLAQARLKRIVYVSCDPESFARDARILADAGYRMGQITPVDQFLWSSHIELVVVFGARGK